MTSTIISRPSQITHRSVTMRLKLTASLFLFSALIYAAGDIEIPVYPGSSIQEEDSMPSSKPDQILRDVLYRAPATPAQVLEFYRGSPYVKKCEANPMAENYVCELKAFNAITAGTLFIDRKPKRGKVEVYASYFCKK